MNRELSFGGQRAFPGFTLIELLVTLAIIAILASLLLPALARGKSAATKSSCISRLKQWNVALMLHADDNDDAIPRESFIPGSTTINLWAQVRNPLAFDVWYNALPGYVEARSASAYAPSLARPSFYSRGLFFHCPGVRFSKGAELNEIAFFSYAMNSKLHLKSIAPTKMGDIHQPVSTVTFLDNRLPGDLMVDPGQENDHLGQPSAFATRFAIRHHGSGTLAFADGHVQVLPGREVVANGKAIIPQRQVVWTADPGLNPNIVD